MSHSHSARRREPGDSFKTDCRAFFSYEEWGQTECHHLSKNAAEIIGKKSALARERQQTIATKNLQLGYCRSPNQNFVLTKLILQLFAIERPPIPVKLFGQHFKH